jgi:AcrR family transcriptional regulator
MGKKKQPAAPDGEEEDARVKRSKKAVLAAALQLLSESGLGGVSIDEVSRRSGVAKTTIYRHWSSRTALLLDACSGMASPAEAPETGSLRGDLTLLAGNLARALRTARWPCILPSIIDAAERDPEVADMHARLHAGHVNPFRVVVERAQKGGELPRGLDPSEVLAAVIGPLFYRRWFSREPLDDRFVKGVVARAVGGAKP